MTRSFSLLVNPASGAGAATEAVVPIIRLLHEAGARVEVSYPRGPSEMTRLVDAAVARGDVVVGAGGDGLLHLLLGPVVRTGATLGIVPVGRGNDFARMLGLPADPDGVAETLLGCGPRRVDLLRYQEPGGGWRYVAGSVYCGCDARAGAMVDKLTWLPLRWQYPLAAQYGLRTARPVGFDVRIDGSRTAYRGWSVVVANSAFYGSGMKIAPAAVVDDGTLDVIAVHAASRKQLLASLPKVYDGSHVEESHVRAYTGRRVEIRAGTGTVLAGGDGEPLGRVPALSAVHPAVVEIHPAAMTVLAGPCDCEKPGRW